MHDPIADKIDSQLRVLDETRGLPESGRQILIVSSYTLVSSNFQTQSRPVENRTEIIVTGHPSPSSDVTSALLQFVEDRAPSPPQYDSAKQRITLFYPHDRIHILLAQLVHANRYIWIGKFAAQDYADIHSHD
ncbi:hypothetical protein [Jannaschia sp. 2305UL9-9]|uniref:hypothetical protein n=1 Tax=Jannaschia sp. 2305UL9-9 TaxID=3121638 RepID=UPI00352847D6